jgi:hypothetical protein
MVIPFVGATFESQADALADIKTAKACGDMMKAFGSITAPGFALDVRSASFDEDNKA